MGCKIAKKGVKVQWEEKKKIRSSTIGGSGLRTNEWEEFHQKAGARCKKKFRHRDREPGTNWTSPGDSVDPNSKLD